MYLSRLVLELRSRAVQRDLADCQQMHRTVLSAFPATTGGAAGSREHFGALYRLEADQTGRFQLLVQSRIEPDWSRLPRGYLLDTRGLPPNPATKPVGSRFAALQSGMVLAFRLRANPTRKIDTKSDGRGRRHGRRVEARDEAAQLAWLRRKAEQGGFELMTVRAGPDVLAVQARPLGKVVGVRAQPDSGSPRTMTFAAVVFDGMLRVVDADRLRHVLEHGIGPGKAYGFGLLSLAPPPGAEV